MTAPQLLFAAVIATFASAVQSALGFGLGMVAIPLLVWLKVPLSTAIALMVGLVGVHTVYNLYGSREHIEWPLAWRLTVVRWPLIATGIFIMGWFSDHHRDHVEQLVGGCLILVLVMRQLLRPKPREQVPASWGVAAGASSGLLAGLVGMGGPPLVLYALCRTWSKESFRVFLWTQFLLGMPVNMAVLLWRFGSDAGQAILLGILGAPFVGLGSQLGSYVARRLSLTMLHRLALGMLYLIAITSLLSPYL